MENKELYVIKGFLGGTQNRYYDDTMNAIAEKYHCNSICYIVPETDWNPEAIANEIARINSDKIVVCLSCGAVVGNMLARMKIRGEVLGDMKIFYICPVVGRESLTLYEKPIMRPLMSLVFVLVLILRMLSKPFKWHLWYPLFGGTKPDGNMMSIYAVLTQLWYCLHSGSIVYDVDGVVCSPIDKTASLHRIRENFINIIVAIRTDGEYPLHVNFRPDKMKRFKKYNKEEYFSDNILSIDGEAYKKAILSAMKMADKKSK